MERADSRGAVWTGSDDISPAACQKTADKKPPTKKMLAQIERVLVFMQVGQEYQSSEIGEVLGVKDSRTKEILRYMISAGMIETVGNNRNRRYMRVEG